MPSAYFLAVRAVVNEEDPVGLIAMDCPEDEYDPEVEDLIKWREPVTPEHVAEVFIRWFGPENGHMAPTRRPGSQRASTPLAPYICRSKGADLGHHVRTQDARPRASKSHFGVILWTCSRP